MQSGGREGLGMAHNTQSNQNRCKGAEAQIGMRHIKRGFSIELNVNNPF